MQEITKLFPIQSKKITYFKSKTDKDDNESVVNISCIIKFIDVARFMASLSSNLADNLTEGIHQIKCRNCDYFLE